MREGRGREEKQEHAEEDGASVRSQQLKQLIYELGKRRLHYNICWVGQSAQRIQRRAHLRETALTGRVRRLLTPPAAPRRRPSDPPLRSMSGHDLWLVMKALDAPHRFCWRAGGTLHFALSPQRYWLNVQHSLARQTDRRPIKLKPRPPNFVPLLSSLATHRLHPAAMRALLLQMH